MMDNHGHENITTYVLTVLNMVRAGNKKVNLKQKGIFYWRWEVLRFVDTRT